MAVCDVDYSIGDAAPKMQHRGARIQPIVAS